MKSFGVVVCCVCWTVPPLHHTHFYSSGEQYRQYSTDSTVQYSTVQYSTVQYSTVQYSISPIPSLLDLLLLLHARYSAMLQCLSIGMKPCRFMMASRCTRVQGRALQSQSQSQFQHQRLSARWTSSKPRSGSNSSGGGGSGSSSGNNRTRDLVISGVSVCCVLGALYYFEQSKAKAAASRNADKAVGKVSMAVCVCVWTSGVCGVATCDVRSAMLCTVP